MTRDTVRKRQLDGILPASARPSRLPSSRLRIVSVASALPSIRIMPHASEMARGTTVSLLQHNLL